MRITKVDQLFTSKNYFKLLGHSVRVETSLQPRLNKKSVEIENK